MKVLLVSADDAHDSDAWSGTAFQARAALQAGGHEVVVLTGLPTTRLPWHIALRLLLGADRYPLWMTNSTLRALAKRLHRAERTHRPDVILSISSQYLVRAHPSTPVVMFSDAPWQTFRRRYAPYQRFGIGAKRFERLEAAAAKRAAHLVYSSQWAKDKAVLLFGVSPDSVSVAPLGANWTPDDPLPPAQAPRAGGPLKLLFIGRDWQRKGGDTAVQVLEELRRMGMESELIIVGVDARTVGRAAELDGVTIIGRTNILDAAGATSMKDLFAASDFLIVPSRAECFGIVYAEAAAFSRPSIALAVDAVGEVVVDGVTGLLFPPQTDPVEIALRIRDLWADCDDYQRLAMNARLQFNERLNWNAFGRVLTKVLEARTI